MSDKEKTTTFENKCKILSELWLEHRHDAGFADFVSHNDVGLPLAMMISEELVTPKNGAVKMIEETFAHLLELVDIMDGGFESLDDLPGEISWGVEDEEDE
jgi:hypothetical protein